MKKLILIMMVLFAICISVKAQVRVVVRTPAARVVIGRPVVVARRVVVARPVVVTRPVAMVRPVAVVRRRVVVY